MTSKIRIVLYNHINNSADGVKYLVDLINIDQVHTERDKFDKKICSVTTVKEKTPVSLIGRGDETFFYLKKHFI